MAESGRQAGGNDVAICNDGNEIVLNITSSLIENDVANEGGSAVFFVSSDQSERSLASHGQCLFALEAGTIGGLGACLSAFRGDAGGKPWSSR